MSSLLTIKHSINLANNLVEEISSTNSQYYIFVARPQPWTNSSGQPDDTAVQSVNNSVSQTELDIYDELLFAKKITPADVIHVAPRYNWTSNTVFDQYDQHDPQLYNKRFFCVTSGLGDQYNVFKCIDNAGGKPSTVKPNLQITSGTFLTGDGYTWKYLYTIDPTANTKFTSTKYIPLVSNNDVVARAIPGTIDVLRISNAGFNYQASETGFISGIPTPSTIRLPNTSSSVDNYYTRSSIYLKSGFGAGQVREIQSYVGSSRTLTLIEPLETFLRLEFANSTFVTGGNPGEIVEQTVDSLGYFRSVGFFSASSDLVQTDTGVDGSILSANSSVILVSKFNKSASFVPDLAVRSLTDVGSLRTDKVNVTNSSVITSSFVVNSGSGYTGNATINIVSNIGIGANATAVANSTGKIASITIVSGGSGYIREPNITVAAPIAVSFNSNTAVTGGTGAGANNTIAIASANVYVVGDQVRYFVAAGNTVINGLSNNTVYFIQAANSTTVALSPTSNTAAANRIQIQKGTGETGHFLQGSTAAVRLYPGGIVVSNTSAGANLINDYAVDDFIRVGENANNNIRRVQSANATTLIVDRIFNTSIISANTYRLSVAATVDTVNTQTASAIISNSNLSSIRLNVNNFTIPDFNFIVGERVELVSQANTFLNAEGTVVFANSSALFLSGVVGAWLTDQRVRGLSSEQVADILSVQSSPNITVKNPQGTFLLGQLVDFRTPGGANTGIANLVSVVNLSDTSVEYEIGPTIKIIGDGTNAIAVASVDISNGTANGVSSVVVINPGSNYTEANVEIYANTLFGSGAVLTPVISPLKGHGANLIEELGARYVSASVKFNTAANESWYYPTTATFRKLGLIKDPRFANCTFATADYTSVDLELDGSPVTWQPNEIVVQTSSNAAGVVISGNSTILKLSDIRGNFIVGQAVTGLQSGASSNCLGQFTVRFNDGEIVRQPDTGAEATVVKFVGNTDLAVTNTIGQFIANSRLIGMESNTVCNLTGITSSDGLRNLTTTFGLRLNQTSRVTLSSNGAAFANSEYVSDIDGNARGLIISRNGDLDFVLANVTGSFTIGDVITNANTAANGRCVFANSSYLKITNVSNSALFSANNVIQNGLGAVATIQQRRSVLILSDISRSANFIPNTTIMGETSNTEGQISLVTNPDLIRETGSVLYLEASNNIIQKTINTTEEIRLVIKL